LNGPNSISFDGWDKKFAMTQLGTTFVPVSGIVYKKITDTNFRLSTPVIPPNLQPFHQQFVNEIAQHGIHFLEIGPENSQLMNERGALLSKQFVDDEGYSWRYFEDNSTLYWDGTTWIEGTPKLKQPKKESSTKQAVQRTKNENSTSIFVVIGQIIGGILTILVTIFTTANKLQSGSFAGQSNQSNNYYSTQGTYQCLCGNVEHASRYMGHRRCPRCGKPMQYR